MQETKPIITKDMILMDIVNEYPETAPILMSYGLHCVGCSFSSFDTLENGIKIHGMDDETFEMLLRDINITISKKD